MGSKLQPSALTNRDLNEIELFYEIAKANGARLSLNEAISLLRPEVTEEEFASALRFRNHSREGFELQSGLLIPKSEARIEAYQLEAFEQERRRRAGRNLFFASKFADFSEGGEERVVSVSGSSSYGSVAIGDDLDFFCITQRDALWLFITRLLILARVFRAFNRDSPSLCFSCMMDESYAKKAFRTIRDGLFARDALNVSIIRDYGFYNKLLRDSLWLSEYYPKLYRQRVSSNEIETWQKTSEKTNLFLRFANLFLYEMIGSYLRLKAHLGNRKLTRDGREPLLFTAKIGKDHCIYESVRYSELRRLYARLRRSTEAETIANQS